MIISQSSLIGTVSANPSKSHEQRLLLGAMLCEGVSQINNIGDSDDVLVARKIIENFGAKIVDKGNLLLITGGYGPVKDIFCGESALCARLFAPISCYINNEFVLNGEKTLLKRFVCKDFEIFSRMNCTVENKNDNLPLRFYKSTLTPGVYDIKNPVSSQLISGFMMAMPLLQSFSKITVRNAVSIPYLLLTADTMKKFGVLINYKIIKKDFLVNFIGNQKYKIVNETVEGDWSSAAFFIVAAAISGKIKITGLKRDSVQADREILSVLKSANVNYSFDNEGLMVEKSAISSFNFDASHCPDLAPALIVLSIFAKGTSIIHGADRLIYKESSRAVVMKEELKKLGVDISIIGDKIVIKGLQDIKSGKTDSRGDHRIAMALTILSSSCAASIEVNNTDCVAKSYKSFFKDFKNLGGNYNE